MQQNSNNEKSSNFQLCFCHTPFASHGQKVILGHRAFSKYSSSGNLTCISFQFILKSVKNFKRKVFTFHFFSPSLIKQPSFPPLMDRFVRPVIFVGTNQRGGFERGKHCRSSFTSFPRPSRFPPISRLVNRITLAADLIRPAPREPVPLPSSFLPSPSIEPISSLFFSFTLWGFAALLLALDFPASFSCNFLLSPPWFAFD